MNIETQGLTRQLNYSANTQSRKMTRTSEAKTILNSAPDADNITTEVVSPDKTGKASGRWTDTAFYILDSSPRGYSVNTEALTKVKAQLKAEGIDADCRTPTHEITGEQREWLSSKYDLAYLNTCSISEAVFGNFMLDLAYLNVFSLEEVENMYAGIFPPLTDEPQMISSYYHGNPETGEGAGYVFWAGKDVNSDIVNEDMPLDHIFNYFKATSPSRTETEYLQMAKEYADQFQNRIKIFNDIFAAFSNKAKSTMGSAYLNIEDASDKFKEDYGSLI
ncbi:MAG: hypothetical protein OSJ43_15745 [Oscillospiraceae bacterium]|nr:hypothetical protein [Oscillospiraceae bacterium]